MTLIKGVIIDCVFKTQEASQSSYLAPSSTPRRCRVVSPTTVTGRPVSFADSLEAAFRNCRLGVWCKKLNTKDQGWFALSEEWMTCSRQTNITRCKQVLLLARSGLTHWAKGPLWARRGSSCFCGLLPQKMTTEIVAINVALAVSPKKMHLYWKLSRVE